MQICHKTHCGSIRENFQDHVLIDKELRLAVIADGKGSDGLAAAEMAAGELRDLLYQTWHITSENEGLFRLQQGLENITRALSQHPDLQGHAPIAACWLHRGQLNLVCQNPCIILLEDCQSHSWNPIKDSAISIPLQINQRLILASEGFGSIADNREIEKALSSGFPDSETFLLNLDQVANEVYDGDDRSIIIVKTETADLTAGIPHEIELFEHVNKSWTIPVWAPLAVSGGLTAAILALALKLRRWLRNFSK